MVNMCSFSYLLSSLVHTPQVSDNMVTYICANRKQEILVATPAATLLSRLEELGEGLSAARAGVELHPVDMHCRG